MTNEELVAEIKADRSHSENMALLYEQNRPFIAKIANDYSGLAEHGDLMQEAYFGLNSAVEHYDPNSGNLFMTYAAYWIRQAIQRYLENSGRSIRLPSYRNQQLIQYRHVIAHYMSEHGCYPSDIEVRYLMGINQQTLDAIRSTTFTETASLDAPIESEGDGTPLTIGQMIADPVNQYADAEDQIQNDELASRLWPMVDALPAREADVIRRTFIDQTPLTEIADDYGVPRSRIQNDQRKALKKLYARRRTLKPFIADIVAYDYGIRHRGAQSFQRTHISSTEDAAFRLIELRETAQG